MVKEKFLPLNDLVLFWECQCKDYTNDADVTLTHHSIYMAVEEEWKLKPYLRPMSSMTDAEVLAVCEIANHLPFVTKKKWIIIREKEFIHVHSKRSEYSFHVYIDKRSGYGDITVFKECEPSPQEFNPDHPDAMIIETETPDNIGLITKFYLDHYLDCFGWIDQGYAISKPR